jgi:membrane protease YdiL (CAAX protease family)
MMVGALGFQGAGILLIWLFVHQHGLGLREAFGLATEKRRALLVGATAALAFMPVALGLQFGIAALAGLVNLQLPAQDAVLILRLADSWADRIALGIVAVVLAPLAEEGLFRGVFYPAIKRSGHPRAALWITSIGFALIHFNALSFVPLLVLAAVLAKLYERTGNLLSCIACHATFNLFNFIMLFFASEFSSPLPAQP